MNIYLLNYNNYGNRIIKGHATLAEYLQEVGENGYAEDLEVNRSISDNLSTSITFNDATKAISASNMPNYCLICDEEDNIVSRWFVLSCKHKGGIRSDSEGGQYTVELKRDVIYDFYENIENSTVMCYRGYQNIGRYENNTIVPQPLFLNKDTDVFPLNSIKYKEVMLKETDTGYDGPWLYIYRTVNDIADGGKARIAGITEGLADLKLSPNGIFELLDSGMISQWYSIKPNSSVRLEKTGGSQLELTKEEIDQICLAFKKNDNGNKSFMAIMEQTPANTTKKCIIHNVGCEATSIENTQTFTGLSPDHIDYQFITSQRLRDFLNNVSTSNITIRLGQAQRTGVVKNANKIFDSVGIESKDLATYNTMNSQFNIYCIPFPIDNTEVVINGHAYTKELEINLVKCLCLDSGCYDIQVLPYGPCKVKTLTSGQITTKVMDEQYVVPIELWFFGSKITNGGVRISQYWDWEILKSSEISFETYDSDKYTIFLLKDNKRTFDIPTPDAYKKKPNSNQYEDFVRSWAVNSSYIDNKWGLNCYQIRLVSPDSQTIEEFNPYFNYPAVDAEQFVDGFHIYMKYQPYSPYLQVLPIYKGYNTDFQDYRGLICGAGFSMAMANDKWAEYQAQNKNFKAQFDRDIQTMQMNQAANVINRIGSGAATGAALGGAYGAALGTAAGAISAGIGLITDQYNIETAKKEFVWNIQNMQAAPRTLRQIDAQNPNFRYYPYIEFYKCTDDEKNRFRDYIRHHGSKINSEGLFTDFLPKGTGYYKQCYIECVIEIYNGDNITNDLLEDINRELSMGVRYEYR